MKELGSLMQGLRLVYRQTKEEIVKNGTVLFLLTISGMAATGLSFLPSIITRRLIDVTVPSGDLIALGGQCLALFIVPIVSRSIGVLVSMVRTRITNQMQLSLQSRAFYAALGGEYSVARQMDKGHLLATITSDAGAVIGGVVGIIESVFQAILSLGLSAFLVWRVSPSLFAVSIFISAVYVPIHRARGRISKIMATFQQANYSKVSSYMIDSLSGLRVVRMLSQEEQRTQTLSQMLKYGYDQVLEILKKLGVIGVLESAAGSLPSVLVYGYGGYLVIRGEASLGWVIACLQYIGRSLGSMTSLTNIPAMISPVIAYAERLEVVLSIPPESPNGYSLGPGRIREVVFADVSIGYDGPRKPLLRGIDFSIRTGETVSLIGPSGSGKTSLAMVLGGFYQPLHGQVLIDGRPLSSLRMRDYRRHIAFVSNDDFIFQGTLIDNLVVAKPDATPKEISKSLYYAGLEDLVRDLPQELQTIIGQGDTYLSSGQIARISLARAILRNPSLLVLDEATANLDSKMEERLHGVINEVFANSIVIVISHRPTTIAWGKRIYSIRNGTIVNTASSECAGEGI